MQISPTGAGAGGLAAAQLLEGVSVMEQAPPTSLPPHFPLAGQTTRSLHRGPRGG